jgi:peptidoglycan/LPS O-acetylase OafA/YrhL
MPRADDPALTAARGLAAFWVFVYHAWLSVGPHLLDVRLGGVTLDFTPLASAGWAGVDVFYVLSGFLLWTVFDEWSSNRSDAWPLASYAKRRALRILPPYYAQVALLAILGLATTWVERPTIATLAHHVTLTHGLAFAHHQAVNNVWWTLSTEAQFYVLLPFLAAGVRRFGWPTMLCGGVAAMLAWRVAAFAAFADAPVIERVWILEQLPGRIDQFLCGMFASHLARSDGARARALRARLAASPALRRALVCVAPVTLVALAYRLHVGDFFLRYWQGHAWLYAWHMIAGVAVAISLHAIAVRPREREGERGWHPVVALGVVSYSLYLWHEILLRWLSVWVKAEIGAASVAAFAVNFAIGLPLSLAVATIWYASFERPFLRARARLR